MALMNRVLLSDILEVLGKTTLGARVELGLLNKSVLVMHVHCLPSLIPLVEVCVQFGFLSENIVLIPKPYSTIGAALEKLSRLGIEIRDERIYFHPGHYDEAAHVLLDRGAKKSLDRCAEIGADRLIIVDDGGFLSEKIAKHIRDTKFRIVSIQQTASGIARSQVRKTPFPKIDVSRSAAKRYFESKIISTGIFRKLRDSALIAEGMRIGVVGIGALGFSLARLLQSEGFDVRCFDLDRGRRRGRLRFCINAIGLLENTDIVLGCVGRNWMHDLSLSEPFKARRFVSCSSRSVEFQAILRASKVVLAGAGDPQYADYRVPIKGGRELTVYNGGFPINFDRHKEWETAEEISLTRALLLAGIVQSINIVDKPVVAKLHTGMQQAIVMHWLKINKFSCSNFDVSDDQLQEIGWWRSNSDGQLLQERVAG